MEVITPMRKEVWSGELVEHPDRTLAESIVKGITDGFMVGYNPGRAKLEEQGRNMQSAAEQEGVVDSYIRAKQAEGRVMLVDNPAKARKLGVHCNPFGVIPKKRKPGKYRLTLNLSAPEGCSVNDGIDKELAGLSYVSVEEVVEVVAKLGRGALMAKRTSGRLIAMSPFTPGIEYCWACNGGTRSY